MNKNIILVLLILLVPLCTYWGLVKDKSFTTLPSEAAQGPVIIKFESPLCAECQELSKIFEEVYPNYSSKVTVYEYDVTKRNKQTNELIKNYRVTLVPTTIFKNSTGEVVRRIEGAIQPKILDNYMKEIVDE